MNTGILYARMGITIFLSLYTTRVTLDALGVEDFGIFNLVGGAIAMLTFLNASMASATQRFMSFAQGQGDRERQRSIFNVSVIMHASIALAVLGILEGVGFILFNGFLKIVPERIDAAWIVYQFAILSTLFTIASVPYDAVINARENMFLFAVLGVVEAALKLGIAIFITHTASDKLIIYSLLTAILTILLLWLRIFYCHNRYPECVFAPFRYLDRPLFKEMTSFAGWSFLGTSTSIIANYGQGIVLNTFFGTRVNAAQGVASQVSGQLSAFAGTMLRALNPLIAKSEGAGNRGLMLEASMMGSKMGFFLMMFFSVTVLLEMPYIFGLWLKNVPDYAVIFCRLLLVRNLIEQLFIPLASSISAVGKIKAYQIVTSILTLFPLAGSFLFFQAGFEPYTLYVVFIVYSLITSGVILYFANKICNLPVKIYFNNVIVRCLITFFSTVVIGCIPLLLMPIGAYRLALVCGLTYVAFFASILFFGFCENEKKATTLLVKIMFNKILMKISVFSIKKL
jgi:O-antigen/teichoic acid export membrane protein